MQISLKPASKETLVIREFELSQSLEVCDNQPSFGVNLRPFWILGFLWGFRRSPQRFLGFHTSGFQIDYLTLITRKCFGKWFSWSHKKRINRYILAHLTCDLSQVYQNNCVKCEVNFCSKQAVLDHMEKEQHFSLPDEKSSWDQPQWVFSLPIESRIVQYWLCYCWRTSFRFPLSSETQGQLVGTERRNRLLVPILPVISSSHFYKLSPGLGSRIFLLGFFQWSLFAKCSV